MKILITGLTLHNNKGGAALALSLIDNLKREFPNSSYYLTVPNFDNNLEKETHWASVYGIDSVFGAIGIKEMLKLNQDRRDIFLDFFKNIDLVVDLNALSYMDLPQLTYKQNLVRNLSIYTIRHFSNLLEIPLIRWTQSYGPFSSFLTKVIVRKDLKYQKNIFTRGEGSFNNIKSVLTNKNVYSFPDIAITLNKRDDYYTKHLKGKKYITLSPSSVIYSKDKEKHIEHFRDIITYVKKLNYEIVIVPHNLMSINPSLKTCDLKVSERILESLNLDNIHLLSEDIDVYNLKGVISNAILHIGARYHSIIASLSSNVPTIAFSWHEKYKDIMRMYGMEEYVYDGKSNISDLFKFVDDLEENRIKVVSTLRENQKKLEKEIDKNLELFMENYNEL